MWTLWCCECFFISRGHSSWCPVYVESEQASLNIIKMTRCFLQMDWPHTNHLTSPPVDLWLQGHSVEWVLDEVWGRDGGTSVSRAMPLRSAQMMRQAKEKRSRTQCESSTCVKHCVFRRRLWRWRCGKLSTWLRTGGENNRTRSPCAVKTKATRLRWVMCRSFCACTDTRPYSALCFLHPQPPLPHVRLPAVGSCAFASFGPSAWKHYNNINSGHFYIAVSHRQG